MIDALIEKLGKLHTVQGWPIVNILHGLRNFSDEHAPVQTAISHVYRMLSTCKGHMIPVQICSSLRSMRNFGSNAADVLKIVEILLAPMASHRDSQWSARRLSLALSGLQRMDFESAVVRSAFDSLTHRLTNSSGELTTEHATLILESLVNKDPAYPEVLNLLKATAGKLSSNPETNIAKFH
jgi:hypothetical protein